MTFTFKVEGLHPAISYIDRIVSRLDTNGEKVLKDTAESVVNDAQAKAAVRTGEMRDGIRVTELSATRAVVEAIAGHSGFVEFGTIHMSAQPFFYVSVQKAVQELRRRMGESLR